MQETDLDRELKSYVQVDEFQLAIISLGVGAEGVTRQATHQGKPYALKIFKRRPHPREQEFLQRMDDDRILKLFGVHPAAVCTRPDTSKAQRCVYIMQYIRGYQIGNYVKCIGRMPEGVARFYFQHLIQAIKHIHSKGVGHCDIKLENLVIDKNLNLKVIDFGHARPLGLSHSKRVGTPYINDPAINAIDENNSSDVYDVGKADLFSAGVVLLVITLGTYLFEEAVPDNFIYKYINKSAWNVVWKSAETFLKKHPTKLYAPQHSFSKEFMSLIESMITSDQNKRLTIDQIEKHPWYIQPVDKFEVDKLQFLFEELSVKHGQRGAQAEIPEEFDYIQVPEVDLSNLTVLGKAQKPDVIIQSEKPLEEQFEDAYKRLNWLLSSVWGAKNYQLKVAGQGKDIKLLVEMREEEQKLIIEGEEHEKPKLEKVGEVEIELYKMEDGGLAMHLFKKPGSRSEGFFVLKRKVHEFM